MKYFMLLFSLLASAINVCGQSAHLSGDYNSYSVNTANDNRLNVLQYRLTNMLIEDYELGLWQKTDSILYVYDDAFPRGHNNFDFVEFSNFMYEPYYSISEWLLYDGVSWEGYYKQFGNFDAGGVRNSINIDSWDGMGYVGNSRVEYTYTPELYIGTILFLDYDGGTYDPYSRHTYTYSDDQLANIVQESYGVDWENSLLIIYTYTPEGRIDNLVYRGWDGVGWYDQTRIIYSYDVSGNLTEKLFQFNDFGWETYGRYVYGYDGSGFNTSVEGQSYDGVDYNSYQLFEFTEFADGLPATNTSSLWDGFIWVDDFRANFFYESYDDGTVNIDDKSLNANLQIFPNPSSDRFSLSFDAAGAEKVTMMISNATGQCVQRQTWETAPGPNRIEQAIPSNWTPGMYQVTLTIGGMKLSQSIMVE